VHSILSSATKTVRFGDDQAFAIIGERTIPTSAIMAARAPQIVRAVKAADLVLNRDEWGAAWIAAHRAQQAAQKAAEEAQAQPPGAT